MNMSYSNTAIFIYVKLNKKFKEREEIQAKGKLEQGEGQYSAKGRMNRDGGREKSEKARVVQAEGIQVELGG
jgi:hypothetical protein